MCKRFWCFLQGCNFVLFSTFRGGWMRVLSVSPSYSTVWEGRGGGSLQPCSERSCPLSWLEIPVLWASFLISILFIPSLPLPVLSNSSTLAFCLSWQRKQHGACLRMEKGCHLVGEIDDWHAVTLWWSFFLPELLCSAPCVQRLAHRLRPSWHWQDQPEDWRSHWVGDGHCRRAAGEVLVWLKVAFCTVNPLKFSVCFVDV